MGQSASSQPSPCSTPALESSDRATDSDVEVRSDAPRDKALYTNDCDEVSPRLPPRAAQPSAHDAYLNRESFQNRSLASGVEFRLSPDDMKSPWFHRLTTRGLAHDALRRAPSGSFLIRPSSHRGLYALSWVKAGVITDSIIYQYPGWYSLKKDPTEEERFASLASLVRHCPFLVEPVPPGDEAQIHALLLRRVQVFLSEALENIRRNSADAAELHWEVSVLDSLETYHSPELCEKRTFLRCGTREGVWPDLFVLAPRETTLLCDALRECRMVTTLRLRGHEGLGRQFFSAVLTDDTFVALCGALKSNRSVRVLDVSTNHIGDSGAEALASLLAVNDTLTSVDMSRNMLTRHGVQRVACGLRYNHAMNALSLTSQVERDDSLGGYRASHDVVLDSFCGAIANSLLRKQELLGTTDKGVYRVHGFLSDAQATALIRGVKPCVAGLYLLYFHVGFPDALRVAFVNKAHDVEFLTVHRIERGYTCSSVGAGVRALSRYASWRVWASHCRNADARTFEAVSEDVRRHIQHSQDLFHMWKVEELVQEANEVRVQATEDVVAYPTLFFLTCALGRQLKIALNAKQRLF